MRRGVGGWGGWEGGGGAALRRYPGKAQQHQQREGSQGEKGKLHLKGKQREARRVHCYALKLQYEEGVEEGLQPGGCGTHHCEGAPHALRQQLQRAPHPQQQHRRALEGASQRPPRAC